MKYGLFLALVLVYSFTPSMAQPQNRGVFRLTATIALPGVQGRIDHMAIDRQSGRLFVAALGNNTVEVVDMQLGKRIESIKDFREPQGILYLEQYKRLYVANGGSGTVDVIDAATYQRIKSIVVGDDADNIRYDSSAGIVFVAYGEGGLAAIDPRSDSVKYTIDLPAHPEAFEIEGTGPRIFVNVPEKARVFVIDKEKRTIIDSWALGRTSANFPMAFDAANSRLFVGCRNPAVILVLDSNSGKVVSSIPIGSDVDDIFFDGKRHRLYASCGEGLIDILFQDTAGVLTRGSSITTRRGARTALFVPDQNRYPVAIPKNGIGGAEVGIFSLRGN